MTPDVIQQINDILKPIDETKDTKKFWNKKKHEAFIKSGKSKDQKVIEKRAALKKA